MHVNFTSEDLIKHLYNETTPDEAAAIEKAIRLNPELQTEMQQLREAKFALDDGDNDRPDTGTLERILAYSLEKSFQETH